MNAVKGYWAVSDLVNDKYSDMFADSYNACIGGRIASISY